jgi:hypothetical protein
MDIEKLRTYRIFGIAMFDLVLAYLGTFLFHDVLVGDGKVFRSSAQLFFAVIPIGVITHVLFNQKTFLNSMVFDTQELNPYKMVFLALVVLTFVI